jgi:hypothetical protein
LDMDAGAAQAAETGGIVGRAAGSGVWCRSLRASG